MFDHFEGLLGGLGDEGKRNVGLVRTCEHAFLARRNAANVIRPPAARTTAH